MQMHGCGSGRGRGHMGRKLEMIMAMRQRGGGWGHGPWGGEGPWGDRGGPRGGRGRGRMFAGGELRLLLLRLIADGSRHGYELIKAIEEMTGGEYAPSPGVVYPTLSLLVDEGKIAEATKGGESDGARKAFTVTDDGAAEVAERDEEADALIERLKALAGKDREGSPPVRRAIGNLFTALRQRMAEAGDKETAHAVADILDEAARRIERL